MWYIPQSINQAFIRIHAFHLFIGQNRDTTLDPHCTYAANKAVMLGTGPLVPSARQNTTLTLRIFILIMITLSHIAVFYIIVGY